VYVGDLGTSGLYTFPNPLDSKVPPGALVQADNVVVSADGVVQSRRGITFIGSSIGLATNQFVDSLFEYQDGWIAHASDDTLWFSSSLTSPSWTEYSISETFAPPSGQVRLRGGEANKNFYLTTSNAIYKQDAINHVPIPAGTPPALDITATLGSSGSGFLGHPAQTAYRLTWSYTDANGNLEEGAPSYRATVINSGGSAQNVTVVASIPAGITTAYTANLYRALQTTSASVPATDNMQLASQYSPNSTDLSNGFITILDVTPDSLLGATFYGSPSQEGATQYNFPPPLATDFCTFQGMTFDANTTSLQNIYITMITTPTDGDTLVINGVTYTAKNAGNNFSIGQFGISTGGTPGVNIDTTSKNLVSCINQYSANTHIYAFYPVGYNDLPGLIFLQARTYTVSQFHLTASNGAVYQPTIPTSGTTYASSNDSLPNSVYVSKLNQPEAVPLVNQIFIGGGDKPIYRVIALRDSVVVMKQDGVFRITGTTPSQLTVTPFDTTIILIAPDSAYTLNNNIFAITSQMVVAISESGVNIESRNIEGTLLEISTLTYFSTATFGLSYESEREYLLCLPSSDTDQTATQIYVYNWLTQAWTHWLISPTSGLVSFQPDNKLYLTPAYNSNFLYQEVKTYNPSGFDFGDDRYAVTISSSSGLHVVLNSVTHAAVGQTLLQNFFTSVITAVDVPSHSVTVSNLFSWANAAATLVNPFQQTVLTTPISANFTHYMKNFSRLIYNFSNANFSSITASCISDVSLFSETWAIAPQVSGAWGLFNWGEVPWNGTSLLTQAVATCPPRQKMLAHWVQVGLSLNQALSNFQFLGCSLSYDIVSDISR
jgi:hypothetical protein